MFFFKIPLLITDNVFEKFKILRTVESLGEKVSPINE